MAVAKRMWVQSPVGQGEDEQKAYVITVPTSWGTPAFSSILSKLYEDPYDANTDVSDTKLAGSDSSSGAVITTKTVSGLTAGTLYRLETIFTPQEGNVTECWGEILAER